MEKAREVATKRSRHQAKVIKFATQGVTGLERRVARQGDQGLLGYILEMLAEYTGTISDGRITLTEDTLRVWALDDSCFRSMTEAYYVPFEGMEDKVTAQLETILRQAEKVWALIPRLRAAFSDDGMHGGALSVNKAINLLNNNTALVQWAHQVEHCHTRRVECSWYYVYPRYGIEANDMRDLCDEVIRTVYPEYSVSNPPSTRNAAVASTPVFRLGGMLTRDVHCVAQGGFTYSSKTTERLNRVLTQFEVDYELRHAAQRKMSSGMALMHSTGTAMICYSNDRDAERGKLSVLPIARWLRSFGEVNDATMQKVVNALRVGTIEYLHSYDQWYDTYIHAKDFSSCMSHTPGYYEIFDAGVPTAPNSTLPLHPIWCYAEHEYLRLAVIRRGDEIVARAIVNNDNMQFYRVYGDYALHAALLTAGYEENSNYLEDITLRSRLIDGRHILHPYVDGDNNYADIEELGDDNVLLHLCSCGDIEVQNTEGGARYYNDPELWCSVCETYHRDGGDNIVHDSDGDCIYEVCQSCYDNAVHAYDERGRIIRNVASGHYDTCELSGDYYIMSALEYNGDLDMMVSASALQEWKESQEDEEEE